MCYQNGSVDWVKGTDLKLRILGLLHPKGRSPDRSSCLGATPAPSPLLSSDPAPQSIKHSRLSVPSDPTLVPVKDVKHGDRALMPVLDLSQYSLGVVFTDAQPLVVSVIERVSGVMGVG